MYSGKASFQESFINKNFILCSWISQGGCTTFYLILLRIYCNCFDISVLPCPLRDASRHILVNYVNFYIESKRIHLKSTLNLFPIFIFSVGEEHLHRHLVIIIKNLDALFRGMSRSHGQSSAKK